MFRNDIEAALERARVAEDQLRRLEAKDEKSQAELDELRATLEAERAELARLRRSAGTPARRKAPRASVAIFAAGLLAAAGAIVAIVMLRGSAPAPQPAVPTPPVAARVPPPVARDAPPPPLSEEIGDEALAGILTAQPWQGSGIEGQLRFQRKGDGLAATLASDDGAHPLKVQLGRMATLTLEHGTTSDGQSLTTIYHGALCSDRRTIRGTLERVLRNGEHVHREQGVFTLTASR